MTPGLADRLRGEAATFLLALQLLTRLPVAPVFSPDRLAASPRWYPAIGLLVGLAAAAVLLAAAGLFPMPVAVLLSLATSLALTGALHEDGLADACDGLGGANPERRLEIMRDSRLGSYGALGLGVTLALKVAALSTLLPAVAALALVAGHAASRFACLLTLATGRYARPAGTGALAGRIGPGGLAFAAATAALPLLAVAAILGPLPALAAVAGLLLGWGLARLAFDRPLGGYTGDTLGAAQQWSELGLLLGLLAAC